MKKVLWLIVCLMTMVLSVNAQRWSSQTFKGDELTGTKTYTATSYRNSIGMVVFYSDNELKLITNDGIFDYNVNNNYVCVIIGLYDKNKNLLSKKRVFFWAYQDASKCQYYREESNNCDDVINHIKNEMGYVRFVASRYANSDFDMEVPCMKHIQRKKK